MIMANTDYSKKKFFTTGQIAKTCGVSIATVQKWIDAGEIESYRLPLTASERRVPRESLLTFMRKYRVPTDELEPKAYRVLVAQEDSGLRNQVERILGDLNKAAQVVTVGEGVETLVLMGEIKPDLLVFDLHLPGIDGLKVMEFLKASAEWKISKVLVLSELSEEERTKLEELKVGTGTIIAKPVTPQQLKKSLLKIVG
jgi:excisionase family DNA binding protein